MFVTVDLYTQSGEHVAAMLLPPFQVRPDIVMFGGVVDPRFFIPWDEKREESETESYKEAFAVFALEKAPEHDHETRRVHGLSKEADNDGGARTG